MRVKTQTEGILARASEGCLDENRISPHPELSLASQKVQEYGPFPNGVLHLDATSPKPVSASEPQGEEGEHDGGNLQCSTRPGYGVFNCYANFSGSKGLVFRDLIHLSRAAEILRTDPFRTMTKKQIAAENANLHETCQQNIPTRDTGWNQQ